MQMDVQVGIHRHPEGGNVRWSVPCDTHAKGFAEVRQLYRRGNATQLGNMAAQVVHPAVHDQFFPFHGVIEQLAGSNGGRTLAAQLGQPLVLIRRKQIFEEIGSVRFQLLGKPDRLIWGQPFMHIVQDVEGAAVLFPQLAEHIHGVAHVVVLVKIGAGQGVFRGIQLVRDPAVKAQLAADMTVSLLVDAVHLAV